MKLRILHIILPPLLLLCMLSSCFMLAPIGELEPSALRANLPVDYDLDGWRGVKQQESQAERSLLADDTIFSKAVYSRFDWESSLLGLPSPWIHVSIVYSGQDMGESIHRPEWCLPSQGYLDLTSSKDSIPLDNGMELKVTRLDSRFVSNVDKNSVPCRAIHYYVFVGHETIQDAHEKRNYRDMYDRVVNGYVQRWAYFQVGGHYDGATGVTREQLDKDLRDLIGALFTRQVDWSMID